MEVTKLWKASEHRAREKIIEFLQIWLTQYHTKCADIYFWRKGITLPFALAFGKP